MDYDSLSTEAKFVLLILYKEYQKRLEVDIPGNKARKFKFFPIFSKELFKDWKNKDDLLDILRELEHAKAISNEWGSDTIIYAELSPQAIAILQNRFSRKIKQIVNELIALKTLLF